MKSKLNLRGAEHVHKLAGVFLFSGILLNKVESAKTVV